jgi:DNA-binding transcriptional regulator LsrR (DeoR family)
VLSVPVDVPAKRRIIGVAMAAGRFRAIKGALMGKLVNGLITNELMAEQLLHL